MTASRRVGLRALVSLTVALCLLSGGSSARQHAAERRPPAAIERKLAALAAPSVPHGSPGAALAYHNAKRLPADGRIDTRAAYRLAADHAAAMPLYSVALGRRLSPVESRAARADRRELKGKWKSLGPGNVGGRTRTVVIDPNAAGTMYVGGVSGGVWKTTNGGDRWSEVADQLQNVAINSMAMHPADSSVLFVGTGEGYFREDVRGTGLPLRGGGVFRTDDAGDSWEMLAATAGEDFWFVNDLVFSGDGDRLYAATRTGVFRSGNFGASWTQILDPQVTGGCLDLAIRSDEPGDVLFASCGTFAQATVYRSKDAASAPRATGGGRTGRASFKAVLSDPGMGRTSLAIAPSDPAVIYALSASNRRGTYEQALHAVFRSDSGGDPGTWEARVRNNNPAFHNTLLLHNPVVALLSSCGFTGDDTILPMGWYVNAIAVDPVDPETVWAAGVDWFRSSDGGRNWAPASFWWAGGATPAPSYTHADQHALTFHPQYDGAANQTLFVGNDGGVWRSDNARALIVQGPLSPCNPANSSVVWRPLNNDLGITQFYHGLPFPNGKSFIGGTQDNGTRLRRQGAGTNSWLSVFGGDGGYVAIDPRDTSVLYVESQNANLQKSFDGGVSFVEARFGLPPSDSRFLDPGGNFVFITPFVMDPNAPDRLWTGGKQAYRTDNGAALWNPASKKLKGRATAIAVAASDSDRVAMGTEKGFVHVTDRALTATGATKWARKRPRKAWVTWVAFDPADADVLYATYGGFGGPHVYRSDDGGKKWRSIDGAGPTALPDIPVHVVVVDPEDRDRLFLGTDLGVFVSTDAGVSWAQENAGFGNIVTESLTLRREGAKRMLYAFTHGRGAWRVAVRPPG